MENFEPPLDTKYPPNAFPTNAPTQLIEPIHDTSSIVSFPDSNGLLSDSNRGNAGENLKQIEVYNNNNEKTLPAAMPFYHPVPLPKLKVIKFAIIVAKY